MHLHDTTIIVTSHGNPNNLIKIHDALGRYYPIKFNEIKQRAQVNKGYLEKWYQAVKCKTKFVCLLEDNIIPSLDTFETLYRNSVYNPFSLIGIHGKKILIKLLIIVS